MTAAGLVLAAGGGSRFGGGKLLAELDGRPLLERVLAAMAAVEGLDEVVVVLGAGADAILARIDRHGARPVVCPDWSEGQAASLRAGLAAVGERDAVVVALGDGPRLAPAAVAAVLAALPGHDAARAIYDGAPGHPVALGPALCARARGLRGDAGARGLLAGASVAAVECGALGAPGDVDTIEDLEDLRHAARAVL